MTGNVEGIAPSQSPSLPFPLIPGAKDVIEYWVDAWQRSILLLDVLRQRGNNYVEHNARKAPHVLTFEAELVLDGRTLPRPVNYALVRIVPPAGVSIDPRKRPFIVFDPRAGHGPGIGGMKHDSEIGVALAAGHPCYFVGFLPEPMPGQTVEDVCQAEARFVEEVVARHPEAEGKPCLIGNCQAGWQIMMMSAIRPDLPGPIMLAGSPLSYWAGVHGKNPMRYLGGLLGGTLADRAGRRPRTRDIRRRQPRRQFRDRCTPTTPIGRRSTMCIRRSIPRRRASSNSRNGGAARCCSMPGRCSRSPTICLSATSSSSGELRTSTGVRVDLRNIQSPIIVFCSWGDDITPPQQALGWILDLYDHEDEIVAAGQTIVYCLHQSIGHLGIFVSGKVATKEHGEFAQAMDLIDVMPPGLYEAVITGVDETTENRELVGGDYLFTLEKRTLDAIRALGGNSPEDELRFAAAARVSEINKGLYRTFIGPMVSMAATEQSAAALRGLHPNRLRFQMFADDNPLMAPVAAWAEQVRANRRPVGADNPFLAVERMMSDWIAGGLEAWGKARDSVVEEIFLNIYGAPWLQAVIGLARR